MGLKFRRGSTAQQSGSLAFGEPYVNTTLGTLVVGGATGDIVLSAAGTGSTGNFGAISGSGLDITGNANIGGNLSVGGQLTIGDNTSDTVNVVASLSSSLIPQTTNVFDLGSATKIWRDLYISTGSIKFVDGTTVVKELSLTTISGLESATGSSNVSITNLNTTTASLNTSVSNLNTTTASLLIETANLELFSGSALGRLSNLETTTASLLIETANLETFSSSALTRLSTLEVETSNLESFTSSINTTIKTRLNAETVVSGSGQINVASTTGDIALGTRTSGNYVASLVAGTNITLSNNSGEGATPTIGLTNNTISGISLGSNLATLTIGTGLSGTSYNGSTGVTIANTGVTSNVAGTGVTVSGGTGAVTISIGQSVATSANAQFNSLGIGMAASATAGRIDATNDIVAFSTSDIRLKENIVPIPNALDKISKISGNTYDWRAELKDVHGYEGNDVGVIAQEVEAVLPQLVQDRDNGYKAVKYDKLVALLIEGIKEQQTQIHSLTLEIEKLKEQKGL